MAGAYSGHSHHDCLQKQPNGLKNIDYPRCQRFYPHFVFNLPYPERHIGGFFRALFHRPGAFRPIARLPVVLHSGGCGVGRGPVERNPIVRKRSVHLFKGILDIPGRHHPVPDGLSGHYPHFHTRVQQHCGFVWGLLQPGPARGPGNFLFKIPTVVWRGHCHPFRDRTTLLVQTDGQIEIESRVAPAIFDFIDCICPDYFHCRHQRTVLPGIDIGRCVRYRIQPEGAVERDESKALALGRCFGPHRDWPLTGRHYVFCRLLQRGVAQQYRNVDLKRPKHGIQPRQPAVVHQ